MYLPIMAVSILNFQPNHKICNLKYNLNSDNDI